MDFNRWGWHIFQGKQKARLHLWFFYFNKWETRKQTNTHEVNKDSLHERGCVFSLRARTFCNFFNFYDDHQLDGFESHS